MSSGSQAKSGNFEFDEAGFLQKIPYPVTPTSIKGVYAGVAPPEGFDPNSASAAELIKAGVLLRRPNAKDDPAVQSAWQKLASRKWLAKDLVVPVMEVQYGKTHLLQAAPKKLTDTSYLTNTWSGAGTFSGTWAAVIGYWHVPTVSKPSESAGLEGGWNSSSWVGLDGFNLFITSNDVLQAGIQQKVDSAGKASYVAWYEWYAPATPSSPPYIYQTNITSISVSPGDDISVVAQYVGKTSGYLFFYNLTTGKYLPITLAPPPGATFKGNTVEWVMEAPDGGEPNSALPKFTPLVFSHAQACNSDGSVTNNPKNDDTMDIETVGDKVLTKVTLADYSVTIDFIG